MPKSTAQLLEQSQRIGVQFLLADLAAALTFLDVAEVTKWEGTRDRNRQNARAVYDTVLRLLPKLSPSGDERAVLELRLAELKSRLIDLGYAHEPETERRTGT